MSPRPSALSELKALRRWRGASGSRAGIEGVLDSFLARARRAQRAENSAQRAWDETAPASLRGSALGVGLSRGTITIRVGASADAFLVDRWLRSGGEPRLIRACGASARRVRVTTRRP